MKRFFIFVFAVLCAAVCLLLANDILVKSLVFSCSNSNMYRMHRLFNCDESHVAIFGSSRAEANFAPSEIGEGVFNYGISGSPQGETVAQLRAFLSHGFGLPVIINLDPWGLGGLSSVQGDYRLVDSPLAKTLQDKKRMNWRERVVGLRFYGKLRGTLADWLNDKKGGTKKIDHGAILQRLSRTEKEWAYIIERCKPQGFVLDADAMAGYDEILSGKHPLVIFVVSPISKPWYERWSGQEELAALIQRLRNYPNTVVVDMCTPNVDKYGLDCYMDLTHLNEKGARRFSRELQKELLDILGNIDTPTAPLLHPLTAK